MLSDHPNHKNSQEENHAFLLKMNSQISGYKSRSAKWCAENLLQKKELRHAKMSTDSKLMFIRLNIKKMKLGSGGNGFTRVSWPNKKTDQKDRLHKWSNYFFLSFRKKILFVVDFYFKTSEFYDALFWLKTKTTNLNIPEIIQSTMVLYLLVSTKFSWSCFETLFL